MNSSNERAMRLLYVANDRVPLARELERLLRSDPVVVAGVVTELQEAACQGDHPGTPTRPTVPAWFPRRQPLVLQFGMLALTHEELLDFILHPHLIAAIYERILRRGGRFWRRRVAVNPSFGGLEQSRSSGIAGTEHPFVSTDGPSFEPITHSTGSAESWQTMPWTFADAASGSSAVSGNVIATPVPPELRWRDGGLPAALSLRCLLKSDGDGTRLNVGVRIEPSDRQADPDMETAVLAIAKETTLPPLDSWPNAVFARGMGHLGVLTWPADRPPNAGDIRDSRLAVTLVRRSREATFHPLLDGSGIAVFDLSLADE